MRPVPHVGPTVGYRVERARASVAYISDHQAPPGARPGRRVVLELCRRCRRAIHDAQYTPAEFARKHDWGHCTIDYALLVARVAARRLVLFHHDPAHTDDVLDRLTADVQASAAASGVQVIAAREGLVLDL